MKIEYSTGEQNFSEYLKQIKKIKTDVVFAPGSYQESAKLIKQARAMGITVPFLGGDTWESPEFVQIGGEAVNDAIFSTHFTAEAPVTDMSNVFLEAYKKKYKKPANAFSALGFDAYILAIDAIERANTTNAKKIRDVLAETENFIGATGNITFDEEGNVMKSAVIKTIEEGKLKYITFVEVKQ